MAIKYTNNHCKTAEDILATGKSLAAVCAKLDIARGTLYVWKDEHPEFKAAIERGLQKCQAYWEDIGKDGMIGNYDKFMTAPWIFTMKNRFRDDYAEEKDEKKDDSTSLLEKIVSGEIKIKHD